MTTVTRKCPSCFVSFQANQKDPNPLCDSCNFQANLASMEVEDDFEEIFEDAVKKICVTHKWVWSGVPRGSIWCAECDLTYDEKIHGSIKDLAKMQ